MKKLLFSFSVIATLISLVACHRSHVAQGAGGEITGGVIYTKCTKPAKQYSNNVEAGLKAKVDQLGNVPTAELDASVKTTVVQLGTYTSQGLDRDLFMFRMCEMANNRGLTNVQVTDLMIKAMAAWDETYENKPKKGN